MITVRAPVAKAGRQGRRCDNTPTSGASRRASTSSVAACVSRRCGSRGRRPPRSAARRCEPRSAAIVRVRDDAYAHESSEFPRCRTTASLMGTRRSPAARYAETGALAPIVAPRLVKHLLQNMNCAGGARPMTWSCRSAPFGPGRLPASRAGASTPRRRSRCRSRRADALREEPARDVHRHLAAECRPPLSIIWPASPSLQRPSSRSAGARPSRSSRAARPG